MAARANDHTLVAENNTDLLDLLSRGWAGQLSTDYRHVLVLALPSMDNGEEGFLFTQVSGGFLEVIR